ncbi:hypothetical protein JTB14_011499 [Gonioctena quinquepunctata]|nr:hypothetical protein JTB14_011499 [Gonioctena quinquepunctata]
MFGQDTVRNHLHEANLRSRRPLRCPPLSRVNSKIGVQMLGQQFCSRMNPDWDFVQILIGHEFGDNPEMSVKTRSDNSHIQGLYNDGEQYVDIIIQPIMPELAGAIGENCRPMHDNSRPHSAEIVSNWLDNEGIKLLPWPAKCPDLNPIEQVGGEEELIVKFLHIAIAYDSVSLDLFLAFDE